MSHGYPSPRDAVVCRPVVWKMLDEFESLWERYRDEHGATMVEFIGALECVRNNLQIKVNQKRHD